jgi:hypothetical protein
MVSDMKQVYPRDLSGASQAVGHRCRTVLRSKNLSFTALWVGTGKNLGSHATRTCSSDDPEGAHPAFELVADVAQGAPVQARQFASRVKRDLQNEQVVRYRKGNIEFDYGRALFTFTLRAEKRAKTQLP